MNFGTFDKVSEWLCISTTSLLFPCAVKTVKTVSEALYTYQVDTLQELYMVH